MRRIPSDNYPLKDLHRRLMMYILGFQILNNGSLRIHHLQVHDTGYYLCWAENLVRRTHAQIRLEVQSCLFNSNEEIFLLKHSSLSLLI